MPESAPPARPRWSRAPSTPSRWTAAPAAELSEAAGGRIDVEMLDVDSPRRCPACKAGMEKARVKGQDVETCSECGGVFLEGVAKDGLDAVGALLERLK